MQAFRSLWRASGLELEDAVQHLVCVLSARLQGAHPFDPSQGNFKNYCFLLTRGVLQNQIEKRAHRIRVIETLAPHAEALSHHIDEDALCPEPADDVLGMLGYHPRVKVDTTEEAWRLLSGG